jgi:hypothetical protein
MSNRLNLVDAINAAFGTGKDATFTYSGTTYTFSPNGIIDWLLDAGFLDEISGNIVADSITTGTIDATGTVTLSGDIIFSELPTADPEIAGQLWNNSGVLTISAGA